MIRSDGSHFCNVFQSGRHQNFEKNPVNYITTDKISDNSKSAFTGGVNQAKDKSVRHKTFEKVQIHRIFGYPSPEVVDHIAVAAREESITILDTLPAPKLIDYETCALSKAHQKKSRVLDKEHPQIKPFERITVELIPMRQGFNSNTQMIHFQCAKKLFNMIFTMYTKSESLKFKKKFLSSVKLFDYHASYFHLDRESTLQKALDDLTAEEGI